MPHASPPEKLVTLFDPALPRALFAKLLDAVVALKNEGLSRTYQTTFWFDLTSADNFAEQAALALWPKVPNRRGVIGVEWWLSRMRTTDVRVDFHRDRDEKRALRGGRTFHPQVSSVLFLNEVRGGALAVTRESPCEDNPSLAPKVLDLELVSPKPNRIAFFDGALTHGVLDRDNQVPHRRLSGNEPLRLAVIFNWWARRPEDVPRLSETPTYRALRNR